MYSKLSKKAEESKRTEDGKYLGYPAGNCQNPDIWRIIGDMGFAFINVLQWLIIWSSPARIADKS